MNQSIQLDYNFTEAEYLAAGRLLVLGDFDAVFRMALFWVLIVIGSSILTGLLTDIPWWVAAISSGVLLGLLYYKGLVQRSRDYFRGDPKFRDRYHFTFSDAGVAVKTAQMEAKVAWSMYTKVLEGADMYLLVYGKDTRMMTMVPKRAFHDEAQEEAFRELTTRQLSAHGATVKLKPRAVTATEYKPTSLNPPDWR